MSQVGSYDIEVILDDYFAPKYVYRFRLNVEDPTKAKKNAMNMSS